MPNQPTRQERAAAELRRAAAEARTRAEQDLKASISTPSWILSLAATIA
jgi:hypothetical protein